LPRCSGKWGHCVPSWPRRPQPETRRARTSGVSGRTAMSAWRTWGRSMLGSSSSYVRSLPGRGQGARGSGYGQSGSLPSGRWGEQVGPDLAGPPPSNARTASGCGVTAGVRKEGCSRSHPDRNDSTPGRRGKCARHVAGPTLCPGAYLPRPGGDVAQRCAERREGGCSHTRQQHLPASVPHQPTLRRRQGQGSPIRALTSAMPNSHRLEPWGPSRMGTGMTKNRGLGAGPARGRRPMRPQ
jgi:hypothetical protein